MVNQSHSWTCFPDMNIQRTLNHANEVNAMHCSMICLFHKMELRLNEFTAHTIWHFVFSLEHTSLNSNCTRRTQNSANQDTRAECNICSFYWSLIPQTYPSYLKNKQNMYKSQGVLWPSSYHWGTVFHLFSCHLLAPTALQRQTYAINNILNLIFLFKIISRFIVF